MPAKNNSKPPKTQQGRVLELLWKKKGGSYTLSREMGLDSSALNVWKRQIGRVPMTHVGQVSRTLKVNKYLLNYTQVFDFFGKGDAFLTVLKNSKLFTEDDIEYILDGKE